MIQLRPTREAYLPFVLQTERDPSNTPFISQWSLDRHDSALRESDIGHWIIESAFDRRPLGYLIAVGLTDGEGKINLRRIDVTCKGEGIGRKAFGELRATEIWLVVYQRNERAQGLYRSE